MLELLHTSSVEAFYCFMYFFNVLILVPVVLDTTAMPCLVQRHVQTFLTGVPQDTDLCRGGVLDLVICLLPLHSGLKCQRAYAYIQASK